MKPRYKRLLQEQLDVTLARVFCLNFVQRPVKGWLRAVREALGMSGKQFAKRLGVSAPRISALEKSEISGAVTINTMRQAADALDCNFVYALVPRKKSLAATVRDQAKLVASKRLARVSHSMLLENQHLSDVEQKKALESEIEKVMRSLPRELWDNQNEL